MQREDPSSHMYGSRPGPSALQSPVQGRGGPNRAKSPDRSHLSPSADLQPASQQIQVVNGVINSRTAHHVLSSQLTHAKQWSMESHFDTSAAASYPVSDFAHTSPPSSHGIDNSSVLTMAPSAAVQVSISTRDRNASSSALPLPASDYLTNPRHDTKQPYVVDHRSSGMFDPMHAELAHPKLGMGLSMRNESEPSHSHVPSSVVAQSHVFQSTSSPTREPKLKRVMIKQDQTLASTRSSMSLSKSSPAIPPTGILKIVNHPKAEQTQLPPLIGSPVASTAMPSASLQSSPTARIPLDYSENTLWVNYLPLQWENETIKQELQTRLEANGAPGVRILSATKQSQVASEVPNKTLATITLASREACESAMQILRHCKVHGKILSISFHQPVRSLEPDESAAATKTLFVANLHLDVTEDQVRLLFMQFGDVISATLVRNQHQQSRGFVFVEFADHASCELALRHLQNEEFCGQRLKLKLAKASPSLPNAAAGGASASAPPSPSRSSLPLAPSPAKVPYIANSANPSSPSSQVVPAFAGLHGNSVPNKPATMPPSQSTTVSSHSPAIPTSTIVSLAQPPQAHEEDARLHANGEKTAHRKLVLTVSRKSSPSIPPPTQFPLPGPPLDSALSRYSIPAPISDSGINHGAPNTAEWQFRTETGDANVPRSSVSLPRRTTLSTSTPAIPRSYQHMYVDGNGTTRAQMMEQEHGMFVSNGPILPPAMIGNSLPPAMNVYPQPTTFLPNIARVQAPTRHEE